MTQWRVPNGSGKAAIGVVVAALIALFAFLNGIPWATKAEVNTVTHAVSTLREDVQESLREIRQDIREIRRLLEGRR